MLVKTRLALGENIYNAIEKTKKEYADVTEMGIILISIYHEGKLCGFRFDKTAIPNAQIKNSVVTAYNTTKKIVENSEMFYTRPELVGDVDNPILVDGIVGLRGYIENLKYSNGIRYERSDVKYVNNNLINLKYAIDEYRLIDKVTGETITKLYFNIYGTANLRTKYVPQIFEN